MTKFSYILDKISRAEFSDEPFRHLYIESLFKHQHFDEIVSAPQVRLRPVSTDEQLIDELYRWGYKEIKFPGTTTDIPTYLKWHKDPKNEKNVNLETCEGFGVTLRLQQIPEE